MRVYLIGFMGAGKTATGSELARLQRAVFWDLDLRVEAALGMSVQEVFAGRGEAFFRGVEAAQLKLTRRASRAVVATGGGTFASETNRETIRRLGVSVFLDVPWEELVRRLPGKQEHRPLFDSPETARKLFESRLPAYRLADLTVNPGRGEDAVAVAHRIALLAEGLR
jgi:shikimate kinase